MNYSLLVQRLYKHFSSGTYKPDCLSAKGEFLERFSSDFRLVSDSSSLLEESMDHFVYWYLFERKQNFDYVDVFISESNLCLEELRPFYQRLKNLRRGLFQCQKSLLDKSSFKKNQYKVKSLLEEKICWVQTSVDLNLCLGLYFDGYILWDEETSRDILVQINLFHPQAASPVIHKKVTAFKKDAPYSDREFLSKLFKMYYRYLNYKNLKVEDLYSDHFILDGDLDASGP